MGYPEEPRSGSFWSLPIHEVDSLAAYSRSALWFCVSVALSMASAAADDFAFEAHTVDPNPGKVVYAVTAADVDGDGRTDAVAVTEDQVLWYQAPDWHKRVIIDGGMKPDNVCIAPHDIDGDGQVDFALGAGWPTNGGTIQWLSRGPSLDDPWQIHRISAEPWTHRMRFADVLGSGRAQLVVSPLNATVADGVRLLAFEIPADPRTDRWSPTILDASLNRLHNHWCVAPQDIHLEERETAVASEPGDSRPAVGDGPPAVTLTASQEGIHAVRKRGDSQPSWTALQITAGRRGDEAATSGAGEIKQGQLADGRVFLATIEPMHGTDVAVYLLDDNPQLDPPERQLIDDSLQGGHAIWCADLDGDGDDEIVTGHREPAPQVGIRLYDRQSDGSWAKHSVDTGTVACEDLLIDDFDGDGRPDILAGGRATGNVRLFLNRSPDSRSPPSSGPPQ